MNPVRSFYQRLFAAVLHRASGGYERLVGERKRRLFAPLAGDVLEIGPGTGPNLALYPPGVRVLGVEPNPHMHPYLRRRAAQVGVPLDIVAGTAERLPVPDASVDAVVSTLVLCSVADPTRVLAEIRRVLRPGGRFVFLEHVAAPRRTRLRRLQGWLRPLWRRLGDGCHPDRETWAAIEAAGFAESHIDHFRLPVGPLSPHIAGYAVR